MNAAAEILFGIVMVVGLVGVVLPVLPGLLLILVTAVVWAFEVGGWQPWVVVVAMAVVMGIGTFVKYQVPGRELAGQDLSTRTWLLATVGAVVGFFVIPLAGLLVGFVLGLYVGQRGDLGTHAAAWASTRRVLGGVGKGIAIEFAAGFIALSWWVVAVLFWL